MDTIDLMLTRRSVKAADMVEPGPSGPDLDRILRAAIRVPDHGKLAPWRIQVLHKEGQARLGDFLADLFLRHNPDAREKQIEFERLRPLRAPVLLVVTAKLVVPHKIPEMEQLLSGGAVCTSVLLAAQALGYRSQWLTEWPAYRSEVVAFLGHDPKTDRILGFLYLGSAAHPPDERPRPAVTEVVSDWAGPARSPT